ncbi:hypothetical protein ACM66B_006348 [Microbotryomycetes sp. NB124-2]
MQLRSGRKASSASALHDPHVDNEDVENARAAPASRSSVNTLASPNLTAQDDTVPIRELDQLELEPSGDTQPHPPAAANEPTRTTRQPQQRGPGAPVEHQSWDLKGLERIDLSKWLDCRFESESAREARCCQRQEQAPTRAPRHHLATPNRVSKSATGSLVASTPLRLQSSASSVGSTREIDYASMKKTFAGRINQAPSIESLLGHIGLAREFSDLQTAAHIGNAEHAGFRENVRRLETLAEDEKEGKGKGPDKGAGEHWFEQLSQLVGPADSIVGTTSTRARLEFVYKPDVPLAKGAVASVRKPDAILAFPCQQTPQRHKFEHIAVPLEFTQAKFERLDPDKALSNKYLQILGYLRDTLVTQPLRLSVPGVCLFDQAAALIVLDRERVHVAYVEDCWGAGVVQLACLARLLVTMDPARAGLSPLAMFDCDTKNGLTPFQVSARLLGEDMVSDEAVQAHPVRLVFKSSPAASPFSRATVVLRPDVRNSEGDERAVDPDVGMLFVKIQNVDNDRMHRERDVWHQITCNFPAMETLEDDHDPVSSHDSGSSHDTNSTADVKSARDAQEVLQHLAAVDRTFTCPLPWQLHQTSSYRDLDTVVERHQGIVVYRNPRANVVQLIDKAKPPRPRDVVNVISRLLPVLLELWTKAGVLHRDISAGNVLHSSGHLVLGDWDCAWSETFENSANENRRRTGTVDTMAIDVLQSCIPRNGPPHGNHKYFRHRLMHDIESAIYVFLKVVWYNIRATATNEEIDFWSTYLLFDSAEIDARTMSSARLWLWQEDEACQEDLLGWLEAASGELARIVRRLLQRRLHKICPDLSGSDRDAHVVKELCSIFKSADPDLLDKQLEARLAKAV